MGKIKEVCKHNLKGCESRGTWRVLSKGWERVYAPNVKFNFTFGFHKLSKVKLLFEFTSVKFSVPVFFGDNLKKKTESIAFD